VDESWLPASIAERVTIHHLLLHTSDLGDFLDARIRDLMARLE
jgi:CubicO group peptidase (beta-lactamase class C family)